MYMYCELYVYNCNLDVCNFDFTLPALVYIHVNIFICTYSLYSSSWVVTC